MNERTTLHERDPDLFAEVTSQLAARDFSPAADHITDALADAFAEFIARTPVDRRCACGEATCRTYRYAVPERDGAKPIVVRFYVRGELLVRGNDAGEVYEVERLDDAADDGAPRARYVVS
ncbi:MAG: hypothetical protein KGN02_13735 [bacterium]|nr:hypothetical protein [bacterium]